MEAIEPMSQNRDMGRRQLCGIAKCRLARALTIVTIGLTAIVSLVWSHVKLFSQDEMYEFQTDSVHSLAQLVHVQRTWPISLDPLLYHSLSHGAMRAFGANEFSQRFPALLGFLLMQVCLFFLVRRLAGERAGAVAAAFPAVTATLYYSAEGRPYGFLLGLYALAMLCWICAVRTERRGLALFGLAAAIAATLNTHYFGVLLLAPIWAAELWRTVERRRIDWPVVAAILAGMLGFAGARPFMKAAGEFKTYYYNGGGVGLHDITRAYRTLFVDYTKQPIVAQHVWMVALVSFALALVWGCWHASSPTHRDKTAMSRAPGLLMSNADWVLLLVLAALPFGGYLLARFVTHSIEVRYVLGAIVAISAMLALASAQWLDSDAVFSAVMIILGLGIVIGGVVRIRGEQRKSAERLASLVLPTDVKAALMTNPDGHLYIQDMGAFEEDRYYEPDPQVKPRMTLVYSADEELRWDGHDTMALTATHMHHFTDAPVVAYETIRNRPGEHIFVLFHTGWDWTDQAFAADSAKLRPIGSALGGDVAGVSFPQTNTQR